MTNAIILSAGQGRRLAPLTDSRPKCLIEIAGRPLLEWQLRALEAAGVRDVTLVTGFGADAVEAAAKVVAGDIAVTCRYNPFFGVADNIGSCWIARDLFGDDTILLNGDTLVCPRILRRLRAAPDRPISLAVDSKPAYDSDDMKVRLDGARLARIGKGLSDPVDGESIGALRFAGRGGARFAAALDATLRRDGAHAYWYLSVIDGLADEGVVGAMPIAGLPWAEVDFPRDLAPAAESVAAFDWQDSAVQAAGSGNLHGAGT